MTVGAPDTRCLTCGHRRDEHRTGTLYGVPFEFECQRLDRRRGSGVCPCTRFEERTDDVTLPPADRCAQCGYPRAKHELPYADGGTVWHTFVAPEGAPRPEHVAECHIQTDWTCTHCGRENDVWGAAVGWMECAYCQGQSYLLP